MNNFILTVPCSEMRRAGREKLTGKWGMAILTVLFFFLLTAIAQLVPYAGSVWCVLAYGPLTFGLFGVFLAISRNVETKPTNILRGFNFYAKALGLFWFQTLFIFLWSLLFVVPGIIAAIRYSQAFYIMLDDPSKSVTQCMDESKAMMRGNCGKYFLLLLSFVGWTLLAALVGSIPELIANLITPDTMSFTLNPYQMEQFINEILMPEYGALTFISSAVIVLVSAPLSAYIYSTTADFYNRLSAGSCNASQRF